MYGCDALEVDFIGCRGTEETLSVDGFLKENVNLFLMIGPTWEKKRGMIGRLDTRIPAATSQPLRGASISSVSRLGPVWCCLWHLRAEGYYRQIIGQVWVTVDISGVSL